MNSLISFSCPNEGGMWRFFDVSNIDIHCSNNVLFYIYTVYVSIVLMFIIFDIVTTLSGATKWPVTALSLDREKKIPSLLSMRSVPMCEIKLILTDILKVEHFSSQTIEHVTLFDRFGSTVT